MQNTPNSMVFYGLNNMNDKLDKIVKKLNLENKSFEIKLIMSEALNNAFVHGNKSDKNKPIYVEWEKDEKELTITVTDSGSGIEELGIYKKINEDNILGESGRGLYIISCYTDNMMICGKSIIMKKYIS